MMEYRKGTITYLYRHTHILSLISVISILQYDESLLITNACIPEASIVLELRTVPIYVTSFIILFFYFFPYNLRGGARIFTPTPIKPTIWFLCPR
ncbi:hypothetical protein L211DRAFT_645672 [Terfezia boudieri ATCC MYA-4762]|uniref:Uncharacterized protein n=1 Tax=Terfezia boudieri ATCC MYA-4762 TaxID=1051890 RepID=A0A3N4LV37_9PEZI|nr:hypothetical protein L211DRAFT_645672 [Terfezia boudieri ATCC MYA-4762]